MSYNNTFKESLSRTLFEENDSELAQLYAIVQNGFTYIMRGRGSFALEFCTSSAPCAKRVFRLIKDNFGVSAVISTVKVNSFGEKQQYRLNIQETAICFEILRFYNIVDEGGRLFAQKHIDMSLLHSQQAKQAYISGATLVCGYVSDPQKSYMAQFRFSSEGLADDFLSLLADFEINAKKRYLKNDIIVYLQRADDISSLMAICSCYSDALNVQSNLTAKDMKNRTKRKVNFETANYNKTIDASYEQIQAIDKIQKTIGLKQLPEHLIQAAQLRMDMPDATLRELAQSATPPISRSTLDKRLRKIVLIAKDIK